MHIPNMLVSGLAVLVPLPASLAYVSSTSTPPPGYATWDENFLLMNSVSNKSVPYQDELTNLHGDEGMHAFFLFFHIFGSIVCLRWRVSAMDVLNGTFHHLFMFYDVTDSADIGSKGVTIIGNSCLSDVGNSTKLSATKMPKQGKQTQVLHGNDLTSLDICSSYSSIVKLIAGGDCLILVKFLRFTRFCWSL